MHVDHGPAGPHREPASCIRLVQYLRRQGIPADVAHRSERDEIGEALLTAASDENASLLVMGAYGRSPLRESLLGGVTASVLRSLTLPVLLAH
jgi:nucleotide-binding universal stress UspA family protein